MYQVKVKTKFSVFSKKIKCHGDGLLDGLRWFQTPDLDVIEYPIESIKWVKLSKERAKFVSVNPVSNQDKSGVK